MAVKTEIPNPYRVGSKINRVFNFIADGEWHTLERITTASLFHGAGGYAVYRRRVASALRTIRRDGESFARSLSFNKRFGYILLLER